MSLLLLFQNAVSYFLGRLRASVAVTALHEVSAHVTQLHSATSSVSQTHSVSVEVSL